MKKQKIDPKIEREMVWYDYEKFLDKFKDMIHYDCDTDSEKILDAITFNSFLLYKLLKNKK